MYCERYGCILAINSCIKRQKLAENIRCSNSLYESLLLCVNCPQGIAVKENPADFSDNDVKFLINVVLKTKRQKLKRKQSKRIKLRRREK